MTARVAWLVAVTAAFLAGAGGAGAWTKVSPATLDNTVDPSALVLPNGAVAIAYRESRTRNLDVQIGTSTKTVAHGLPSVGDPQLLRLPNGSLLLIAAENTGVVMYTSTNGGASWAGPVKTASTDTGDVQAAAARKDGTPLFAQDGTGFVNVYQGAGGEQVMHNVFVPCCGYAGSLAVDSHGLAQIAFWSNASGHAGYLYGRLDGGGGLAGSLRTLSTGETVNRDNRVPLVADAKGNTFVAFSNGYPASTSAIVETLHAGATAHTVTLAHGSFTGDEPLLALAVDSSNRLWALWTQGGQLWGARSRSGGAHFGASVHVALAGSAYVLEAAARTDGSVDAIVNNGSALEAQQLLPGLTVKASATGVRVLDDGFPVTGATVSGSGTSVKTNASGSASIKLPAHTALSVSAHGYAPASAQTP